MGEADWEQLAEFAEKRWSEQVAADAVVAETEAGTSNSSTRRELVPLRRLGLTDQHWETRNFWSALNLDEVWSLVVHDQRIVLKNDWSYLSHRKSPQKLVITIRFFWPNEIETRNIRCQNFYPPEWIRSLLFGLGRSRKNSTKTRKLIHIQWQWCCAWCHCTASLARTVTKRKALRACHNQHNTSPSQYCPQSFATVITVTLSPPLSPLALWWQWCCDTLRWLSCQG